MIETGCVKGVENDKNEVLSVNPEILMYQAEGGLIKIETTLDGDKRRRKFER
jgi:hypothetical protein